MRSDCTFPMFDVLTQDLITEIFVRLPVKSILRCKSVSKSWLSLISNPNFINSHLKHTITTPPAADQTLIVGLEESLALLHLDSCEIGASLGDFSFAYPFFETHASCNGIVCFSYSPSLKNPNIYLYNPATKQAKQIPPHNMHFDDDDVILSVSIGFGFDPVSVDYKLVALLTSIRKPRAAEVYSANNNVWRRVEPNPDDHPFDYDFDVCVNGVLCCVGQYDLMAFDLYKEVFIRGIECPNMYAPIRVTDSNGCIAVIGSKEIESHNVLNLWTLEDEACLRDSEIEASWTLILSIDVGCPVKRVFGYFTSGDILLCTEDNVWLLYNSDKKEARNVPFELDDHQILKYNESLVSIAGFKEVNWNAYEDDN